MADERDDKGRFASTAVTRKRDAAIAEIGEDMIYGMVAEGLPMRVIADNLGLDGDNVQAREAVRNWLRRDGDRYEEAKKKSVDALAEKAGEVYGDETPTTTADTKWRNDRSGYYRWLAEMRAGLRGQQGVDVNLNFGDLYLEALQAKGSMTEYGPERKGYEAVEGEDFETLESPSGSDGDLGKREYGDMPKRG